VSGEQVVQAMGRRVDKDGCLIDTEQQIDLEDAIESKYQKELSELPKLELNGKSVTLVKDRIAFFRRWFNGYSLSTNIVKWDAATGGRVVVSASVISDKGVAVASGHSETTRKGSERDFPVEIAETKAIGRALAALGIFGGEYASWEELAHLHPTSGQFKPVGVDDTGTVGNADAIEEKDSQGIFGKATTPEAQRNPESDDVHSTARSTAEKISSAILASLMSKTDERSIARLWDLNEPVINNIQQKDPEVYKSLILAFNQKKESIRNKGDIL
jgi:hypothetical protein